jgi:hypothetical protein
VVKSSKNTVTHIINMTSVPTFMDTDDRNETEEELHLRYLQYTCTYKACKYTEPNEKTWGGLIKDDYPHFVELMKKHVPLDSNTFKVLSKNLHPPDLKECCRSTRVYETEEAKQEEKERFLDLTCTHTGRMNGKKWRDVLKKDYNYFMWSVGNTMGRETKTFKIFVECLTPADKVNVLGTPKGKVKGHKKARTKM